VSNAIATGRPLGSAMKMLNILWVKLTMVHMHQQPSSLCCLSRFDGIRMIHERSSCALEPSQLRYGPMVILPTNVHTSTSEVTESLDRIDLWTFIL
jgi:hypothetical protein